MSRIGKQPITVPAGVDRDHRRQHRNGEGSQGRADPQRSNEIMTIKQRGRRRSSSSARLTIPVRRTSFHGLVRTLISQHGRGRVHTGFSKKLQLVGVGYRAALKGTEPGAMQLGYSHPVIIPAPENITFSVPSQTEIVVFGPSKEQVGQVAANIRKWRKPEPYKGKGIRYEGEMRSSQAGQGRQGRLSSGRQRKRLKG